MIKNYIVASFSMFLLVLLFFSLDDHGLYLNSVSAEQTNEKQAIQSEFANYYNPYSMIKIQYPTYWNVTENQSINLVTFKSPIESVGVYVQNKLSPHVSLDETTMNILALLENNLSNVRLYNTDITLLDNNNVIQTIEFTYGKEPDSYKVIIKLRTHEDRLFIFSYFSQEELFNRFYPLAYYMYDSVQTPSFDSIFGSDRIVQLSNESGYGFSNGSEYPISNKSLNISPNSTRDSEEYLNYTNKQLGIKIEYPSNLTKIEQEKGVFFSDTNKNLNIILASMPISYNNTNDFSVNHLLDLNKTLENLNIINSSTSEIMGKPTEMILFNYKNGTELYTGTQIWTVTGNNAYIFTFYAPNVKIFDEGLPILIKMVESFQRISI